MGHVHNVGIDLRLLRRLFHLSVGSIGAAVADILPHRVGKEEHILLHNADGAAERLDGHMAHIAAIHGDRALLHIVKAGDQLTEGGLTAARRAHDGHRLPCCHADIHAAKNIAAAIVGEVDILHADLPCHRRQGHGIGRIGDGGLRVHQFAEPLQARHTAGEKLSKAGQFSHRGNKGGDIEGEGHHVHQVHGALHDKPAAACNDRHI